MKKPQRRPSGRPVTTRSGKVLKVNRSLGERYVGMKQAKALRKVNRLRGLPKSRLKRLFWRLKPSRLAAYWFSRDGAIMALKIVGLTIVALFILTLAIFAYYRKDLKDISDISGSNLGGSISYYDRTGKILLWQDYSAVKRIPVDSKAISPYLKQATVAIEDRDFYKHRGFDIKGIIRAAYVDVLQHGSTQGGSTITQQLVKLTQDFNQNRTFSLKVKELILAVELERTYTKDQILTSYLNVVPYGGVDYGAQAAAGDYFHKSASDLTLPESAMLAAIPKSPAYYSKYSAYFDKKLFLDRYNYVLDQMADQGMITKSQASAAKNHDILAEVRPEQTKYAGIRAPYFVLAAKNQLESQFAAKTAKVGGWKVITTLDMRMQKVSEERVKANLPNVLAYGGDEEATVTEDVQTGQMLALVGGANFNNPTYGQINYAQWPISPGSSIKPYDYSALIQNTNAGAGSILYDVVDPLPGYPCTNRALPPHGNCLWDFDRRSPGPMTIRYALGGSRNIPAIKATLSNTPGNYQASINKVDKLADAMMDGNVGYHCYKPGVDVTKASSADQMPCTPSSGIGDGGYLHLDQHLNGLSTLGRMGQAIPATYILKIYSGTTSKPFYQWKQPKPQQVMNPQTAYILNNMLSDPKASYFNYYSKFQHY
ncbi:MAG TPA: transglycosylase domain-containing protein, partial [Candidatus Saccharimonadales bacterium]|nr:transglycosylase domain-containing protein [Candidatus Saccharimonadales bacterium]